MEIGRPRRTREGANMQGLYHHLRRARLRRGVFRGGKDNGGKRGFIYHLTLHATQNPDLRVNSNPYSPFGLNRTTLTAAECLFRVARYSTLGDLEAFVASAPPAAVLSAKTDAGMMLGYIIHN